MSRGIDIVTVVAMVTLVNIDVAISHDLYRPDALRLLRLLLRPRNRCHHRCHLLGGTACLTLLVKHGIICFLRHSLSDAAK